MQQYIGRLATIVNNNGIICGARLGDFGINFSAIVKKDKYNGLYTKCLLWATLPDLPGEEYISGEKLLKGWESRIILKNWEIEFLTQIAKNMGFDVGSFEDCREADQWARNV